MVIFRGKFPQYNRVLEEASTNFTNRHEGSVELLLFYIHYQKKRLTSLQYKILGVFY